MTRPPASASPWLLADATFYALYTLVFIMPVNIQLSKISNSEESRIQKPVSRIRCRILTPDSCLLTSSFGWMVGPDGIEPSTSPLSGVRSSHLSYGPRCVTSLHTSLHYCPTSGGAGRDRTGDLLNANQALSQLSYSPFSSPAPHLPA